ncbi:UNVERIFIED_ORG: hypothetical protein GGI57_006564 [Rhizobium aethiopicum]
MQPLGGQNMGTDQVMDRLQGRRAGSDLIGQCGETESDAFPGVALSLAVQWLMLAELLEQDCRQQVGSCPSAWCPMEGGRWLADLLAVPTGELLAHRLDPSTGAE